MNSIPEGGTSDEHSTVEANGYACDVGLTRSPRSALVRAGWRRFHACGTCASGSRTHRRPAVGGEQCVMLGYRKSLSESRLCGSFRVERSSRDVHRGVVVCREHEASATRRNRHAQRICVAACHRHPRGVRHQERHRRIAIEDSGGGKFAVDSKDALLTADAKSQKGVQPNVGLSWSMKIVKAPTTAIRVLWSAALVSGSCTPSVA